MLSCLTVTLYLHYVRFVEAFQSASEPAVQCSDHEWYVCGLVEDSMFLDPLTAASLVASRALLPRR
jgi:hypothetical protein